ncbi:MAG: dockerin type I repeat-containing protein, partial [Clostridia bacterium]|nr:dockerin type I repeat-containing protein [Clostridia bacterium]
KLLMVKVDGKDVTGFDGDVTEIPTYNYITKNNYINVTVLAEDSSAKVTGIGKINFVNNVATTNIVVTAENGTQTIYKLVVKKISTQEAIKVDTIVGKMGVKVNGNIIYGISPGTVVTTIMNTVTSNSGYATIYDKGGLKKTGCNLVTGDKIEISGTNETKTYIISVRGDVNADGSVTVLDLLRTQKHILKSVTLVNEQFYAADTNYDGVINVVDLLKIQKHILGTAAL